MELEDLQGNYGNAFSATKSMISEIWCACKKQLLFSDATRSFILSLESSKNGYIFVIKLNPQADTLLVLHLKFKLKGC